MKKWFSASFGDNENENSLQQMASSCPSSSLLSYWNSYATTRSSKESSKGSGTLAGVFDIESAVSQRHRLRYLQCRLPFTLGFLGSMVGTIYGSS